MTRHDGRRRQAGFGQPDAVVARQRCRRSASPAGCLWSGPGIPWGLARSAPTSLAQRVGRFLQVWRSTGCSPQASSMPTAWGSPGRGKRKRSCHLTVSLQPSRLMAGERFGRTAAGGWAANLENQKSTSTAPQVKPPPTPSSMTVVTRFDLTRLDSMGPVPAGWTRPRCCHARAR